MKDLFVNDYLKNCPKIKLIINWWELPEFRKIKVDYELQRKLFSNLIKVYTRKKLENLLKRTAFMIENYTKIHRAITIGTLKRAIRLSKIDYEFINMRITEISGIKNPKLPFNLKNEFGAEVIMAFLSDGHNPKDASKNPKYQAGEIESHTRIIDLCHKILGNFYVRTDREKNKKYQSYFPCVVGDVLEFAGVPRGNKTYINPFFPREFLINKNLLIPALRRSFTDEGSCYPKYNIITLERSVDITDIATNFNLKLPPEKDVYLTKLAINIKKKNNLILGEHLALKFLGINSYLKPIKLRKNKDGSVTLVWKLSLTRIDDIKNFRKLISFLLNNKNEKVDEILIQYRKYNRLQDSIEAIEKLKEEKNYFTYQEFAKLLNVHKDRGLFHLRRLIKNGYVLRLSKNKYCGVKSD